MFNGRMIFGGILILIGVSQLFRLFGLGEYWAYVWPLVVIATGAYMYSKERYRMGLLFIMFGIIFLLAEAADVNAFSIFFPLLFIYFGLSIFGVLPKFGERRIKMDRSSEDTINELSVFGGVEKAVISKNFLGGESVSIFGATKIDLTEAKISKDNAVLDITAIFGGCEVIVPKEMNLLSQGTGIFGAWEDKTDRSKQKANKADKSENLLTLRGEAIFGGVSIKN